MTALLHLDPDVDDARRFVLYESAAIARRLCLDNGPYVDDLSGWSAGVLTAAGHDGRPPRFAIVETTPGPYGWYAHDLRAVVLHRPHAADAWLITHELAHWLRPEDGHGPRFAGAFLQLVAAGIDQAAADALWRAFRFCGVEVAAEPGRGVAV